MNETSLGSSGASNGGGYYRAGGAECSPLQTRAPFLRNWSWKSVVSINERACSRGGSQHGFNSETGGACESLWEKTHGEEISLLEAYVQELATAHIESIVAKAMILNNQHL